MTGTEITPLHPFQDDLAFLNADDQRLAHHNQELATSLDKKDSFIAAEMAIVKPEFNAMVSSPCPSLSTLASSSPSSMRTARLSLPSIWNSNISSSNRCSSIFDSSCLSSTSPLWSYPFCDFPPVSPNKSPETNAPPSPCGYQQPPDSLRNIWCNPTANHHQLHQPSHQRRMSLSDDRSSLVPETQHQAKGNSGYGRRHSVAGPFIPKTATKPSSGNVYRWIQDSDSSSYFGGATNGYSMKAIDEDETFAYANTQYSRYQQHILNKGILDHIDEYFGGNNKKDKVPDMDTGLSNSIGSSYFVNASVSPTRTPPSSKAATPAAATLLDTNFGKTMTAGGDAITFGSSNILMGKGIPLHHFLDSNTLLYLVEFKTNRTDICYIMQGDAMLPQIGDLVITEADRGRDLGKVVNILTANTIIQQQQKQSLDGTKAMINGLETGSDDNDTEGGYLANDESSVSQQKCQVKRLYRLANAEETASLKTKQLDEEKALMVCQAKIQQKELPMQVVNAEYQWDRRKLTFYFMADQRIDFRELVRELFKTYKTRIWMCALKSNANNKLDTV